MTVQLQEVGDGMRKMDEERSVSIGEKRSIEDPWEEGDELDMVKIKAFL